MRLFVVRLFVVLVLTGLQVLAVQTYLPSSTSLNFSLFDEFDISRFRLDLLTANISSTIAGLCLLYNCPDQPTLIRLMKRSVAQKMIEIAILPSYPIQFLELLDVQLNDKIAKRNELFRSGACDIAIEEQHSVSSLNAFEIQILNRFNKELYDSAAVCAQLYMKIALENGFVVPFTIFVAFSEASKFLGATEALALVTSMVGTKQKLLYILCAN
jgi:hypothetical protein